MNQTPLVVDLDGTLLRTDMLFESLVGAKKFSLRWLIRLALGLLKGKARFKAVAAEGYYLNCETLPFRREVLDLIEVRSKSGHDIVLATAASETIARQIADQLGLFSLVLSSNDRHNLSGLNKAAILSEKFGVGGFDYIGNSVKDFPVWEISSTRYLAGNNRQAIKAFDKLSSGIKLREDLQSMSRYRWPRALRLHQWVKNLLVFTPAIAGHVLFNRDVATTLGLAFLSFSLLASAVYLLNDVLDIQLDRVHPLKRLRPIPSGEISIGAALTVSVGLLATSIVLGLALPSSFVLVLVGYFLLTCLYSFMLKRVVLVDVIILSGLYTLRVIAGGFAVGIQVSFWLLAFSFFLFLSLSFLKRSSELSALSSTISTQINGRGYETRDLSMVNVLGVASGLLSVAIFSLYLHSDTQKILYGTPEILWLAVPLLAYWVSWIWVKAGRCQVDEDPVLFALKDKTSLLSGALLGAVFFLAQFGFG